MTTPLIVRNLAKSVFERGFVKIFLVCRHLQFLSSPSPSPKENRYISKKINQFIKPSFSSLNVMATVIDRMRKGQIWLLPLFPVVQMA